MPASAHTASEPRLSVPLNELSRGLGVTFYIYIWCLPTLLVAPLLSPWERGGPFQQHQVGELPNTHAHSHPPGLLGPRAPAAPSRGAQEQGRACWLGPLPAAEPSKITAAQKAWNAFGLIFGIAVGNGLGQM